MDLSKLTIEELLERVDRTDPIINILAQRLDQAMDLILNIAENHAKDMVEIYGFTNTRNEAYKELTGILKDDPVKH